MRRHFSASRCYLNLWSWLPLILLANGCARPFSGNGVFQSYSGPPKPHSEISCLLVQADLLVSIEGHWGFRPPVPWDEAYPEGRPMQPQMSDGSWKLVPGMRMVGALVELLPGRQSLDVIYFNFNPPWSSAWTDKPERLVYEFVPDHSYVLRYVIEGFNQPRIRFLIEDVTGDPKWNERIQAARDAAMKDPTHLFYVPDDGRP